MATHTFHIDGIIGDWGFSKQYVRSQLDGRAKDQVVVKISSLGGSVDHAISIFDQFAEHGNVTAELSAFVASAATLISLGAKKVRMNENSFYLIHKPMNWVDEWNTMNEDDIEALIERLEKQKKELAKITLQMAKMYIKKTGKTLDEIIGLMKQDTWLNSEEALEWGFVDEIYAPDNIVNYLDNAQMVAMITANGMPLPRKREFPGNQKQIDEDSLFDRLWSKILAQLPKKNGFVPNSRLSTHKNKKMIKQFENVNRILGIEALNATENDVYLNEEQLQTIDEQLAAASVAFEENSTALAAQQTAETERDQAVSDRDAANTERDTAVSERETAVADLAAALELFNAIDPTVAAAATAEEKANALRALLAAKPGETTPGTLDKKDPKGSAGADADWEIIDQLEHNKKLDNI